MRKKITFVGLLLMLMLLFTGCEAKKESTSIEPDQMKAQAQMIVGSFQQMNDDTFDQFENMSEFQLNAMLMSNQIDMNASDFIGMIEAWRAGLKECGDFVDIGEFSVKETKTGAVLSADAQYTDRNALIEMTFNEKGRMENLTVSAHYGTGEILKKAVMNTILGMGTVFIVLIFISYMISLFKMISNFEERKKAQAQSAPSGQVSAPEAETSAAEETAGADTDDMELAAVISAAIAAAEGTSTDGFIVRSIKRRKTNKWV